MSRVRVAVFGYKHYPNLDQVRQFVGALPENAVILLAGYETRKPSAFNAAVLDAAGERLVEQYPAEWGTFGMEAGSIRDIIVAGHADGLVLFFDERERNTKNTISRFVQADKGFRLVHDGTDVRDLFDTVDWVSGGCPAVSGDLATLSR